VIQINKRTHKFGGSSPKMAAPKRQNFGVPLPHPSAPSPFAATVGQNLRLSNHC